MQHIPATNTAGIVEEPTNEVVYLTIMDQTQGYVAMNKLKR
jgi:hypothetical protein